MSPQTISEAYPPRRVRAMLADVVMISADLEMLLCLAYCQMQDIDPRPVLSDLSRPFITTKIKRLRILVKESGNIELIEQYAHFERVNSPFLDLRNTLAHGRYTGRYVREDQADVYIFLNPYEPDDQRKHRIILDSLEPHAVGMIFQNTTEAMIKDAVKNGRMICQKIKQIFRVQYLHERYPAVLRAAPEPTG